MKRARPVVVEAPDPLASEVRALARRAGPGAIRTLVEIASGTESGSVRLSALKELLDRGFGRPAAAPSESGAAATAHLVVDDGYAD